LSLQCHRQYGSGGKPGRFAQHPQTETHILYQNVDEIAGDRFAAFFFESLMASDLSHTENELEDELRAHIPLRADDLDVPGWVASKLSVARGSKLPAYFRSLATRFFHRSSLEINSYLLAS